MSEPLERVELEDEEGNAHEFEVYDVIEVEDNRYALLIPVDDEEEDSVYLFRFDVDEEGEEVLTLVEDDDEWEAVEAFLEEQGAAWDLEDDGDDDDDEDT